MPTTITHKYRIDPVTLCWVWQGSLTRGYGPHRRYYTRLRGPIPDGLHIDHLCRNPACVNPDHMECVTKRENTLRGEGPAAVNFRKTHCIRGHEYTPENTVMQGKWRACRTCKNEYFRRYRQENAEKFAALNKERYRQRADYEGMRAQKRKQRRNLALSHFAECVVCGAGFVAVTGITCSRSCRGRLSRRAA